MKLEEMRTSFLKNDNQAFEYVYNTCGRNCIGKLVAKRNCSEEDAEDLFIDAVLLFRTKLINHEIEYLTNLKSYIFRICENNFLAKLKKQAAIQSKSKEVEALFYEESEAIDPALSMAAKYSWDQLSEKCKDIIYLFYVEAISMVDIAKQLGLSNADTAKSTKSRCFKKYVTLAKEYATNNNHEAL